ncbi:cobyrinic acid a,c-diamide synthase [Stackebrandtia albiflava]|uniref:Cobyrinic acid a,c-diamide synthase n=1 Tax=Stackebrandtia albiflava TaxID=406432 RepID=A0A562VAI8_9ACTN|nr:cobyrinate a,c-diamide synthase [Stackebrandtia albiflava]TWJ14910.1 cobyrinic acid a,c-diamide synthase [Stackebrandtia albiflava]
MTDVPRLVVSAPSSGHGKTAVAAGLLAALSARELRGAGFKAGPDHVDAGYLGMACGRVGRNLDARLTGQQKIAGLFAHGSRGADIAVVEGNLGLFDSPSMNRRAHSTAQLAQSLRAPVVLVVDAASSGQSVAALVEGFRNHDELLWLAGVILTKVGSDRHEQILREALAESDITVLGALRRHDLPALPARHHGLVPVVDRSMEALRAIRRLGEVVLERVDLDRLLSVARSAPRLSGPAWSPEEVLAEAGVVPPADPPLVAVAGGSFFTYSYAENVELLQAAGAQVAVVDPLRDELLPEGARALVFGGGFPEWYVDELSSNVGMSRQVRELAAGNAPVVAESSGYIWLAEELDGRPMSGALAAAARTVDQAVLGYRVATAHADSVLCPAGVQVIGHKSHRTQVSPRAGDTPAWELPDGRTEGYVQGNVHASYLSLHWAQHPRMAARLVSHID